MSSKKNTHIRRTSFSRSKTSVAAILAGFVASGIFVWGGENQEHSGLTREATNTPDSGRVGTSEFRPNDSMEFIGRVSVSFDDTDKRNSERTGADPVSGAGIAQGADHLPSSSRVVQGGSGATLTSVGIAHVGDPIVSPVAAKTYADTHADHNIDGRSNEVVASAVGGNPSEQVFELAALGPVEAVSLREDGSTEISILGQSFISSGSAPSVAVGDYVFAASTHESSLDFFVPIGEDYLQGVSEVRVFGTVNSIRPEIAQFSIGETSFDYSNLLSDIPEFSLIPGEFVEVAGNQHVAGGSILLGIHGSGIQTSSLQGIHGSGIGGGFLQGIHGSGIGGGFLQGIHGSGIGGGFLQGIHGSGIGGGFLQGIHGSGIGGGFLQGIHGSGIGGGFLQGIHGSGIGGDFLQGIHGSGIANSSLQGIHGSGIGGGFLQGIHGSGIANSSLQGIHGSGIGGGFLQGIHGSGIANSSLQGIHGSGIGGGFLQGIHGSGISQ
jgi:hypothetical protein